MDDCCVLLVCSPTPEYDNNFSICIPLCYFYFVTNFNLRIWCKLLQVFFLLIVSYRNCSSNFYAEMYVCVYIIHMYLYMYMYLSACKGPFFLTRCLSLKLMLSLGWAISFTSSQHPVVSTLNVQATGTATVPSWSHCHWTPELVSALIGKYVTYWAVSLSSTLVFSFNKIIVIVYNFIFV